MLRNETELLLLLLEAPEGEYLIEERGELRLLLRISEGEPSDTALEPAEAWAFKLRHAASRI
jgi:hypothetical protein